MQYIGVAIGGYGVTINTELVVLPAGAGLPDRPEWNLGERPNTWTPVDRGFSWTLPGDSDFILQTRLDIWALPARGTDWTLYAVTELELPTREDAWVLLERSTVFSFDTLVDTATQLDRASIFTLPERGTLWEL
jgi:hypothetical protein